jgi:hypothetical protein
MPLERENILRVCASIELLKSGISVPDPFTFRDLSQVLVDRLVDREVSKEQNKWALRKMVKAMKNVVSASLLLVCLSFLTLHDVALAQLQTWSGSYTYNGIAYPYTLVGKNPSLRSSNSTTTIPVYLVPVKLSFLSCTPTPCVFDPANSNVVQTVIQSPIFDNTTDYVQNGVDLGTTQYLDAYERGNYWQILQSIGNTNYHLMLGQPTVTSELTLTVPANQGCAGSSEPYGYPSGDVSFNWIQLQYDNFISSSGSIPASALTIFLAHNVLIDQNPPYCPLPGRRTDYHQITPDLTHTYIMFGYMDPAPPGFTPTNPDVSMLAHEVGEWAMDPIARLDRQDKANHSPCGLLEVGDPLQNSQNYCYPVHNFTYHLQDLTFLPWFGAPSTSIYPWSFQGEAPTNGSVCGDFPAGPPKCP